MRRSSELHMSYGQFTASQLAQYHRDGYYILRRLFDGEEIDRLATAAKHDREMDLHAFQRDDGSGASVRLSLWNQPGDGIYGMFARCRRVVDSVEQILEDEAYHYHSKMIMKDAKVGGAWAWHQDYGYWYENGVMFPDLVSVYVAVDAATRENGCMQLLRGSHKLGRVDHVLTGEQAGADRERVAEALKRFDLVYAEMKPGDALFFHPNTLHASARNESDKPRWGLICCYNAKHNDPYKDSHHPRYTPLAKVDDAEVKRSGGKQPGELQADVDWLINENDRTTDSLVEKQELKA